MDSFSIIKYPLGTESSMKQIEDNNTLTFIVNVKANKGQIKRAVKKLYEVDAVRVNTLIRSVLLAFLLLFYELLFYIYIYIYLFIFYFYHVHFFLLC